MIGEVTQANRLCLLFCNVIEEIIAGRVLKETVGNELSKAQFHGLQFVYLHPRCSIKDLARGLGVSHPAAVKLVERIEAKELIQRSPYEKDRRVVQLEVTARGEQVTQDAMHARNKAIDKILQRAGFNGDCDLTACLERFIMASLDDQKDTDGVCLRCGGNHLDDCPVCQAELAMTGHPRTDS